MMSAAFSAAVRIHSRTPAVSVFLLGISSYFFASPPLFLRRVPAGTRHKNRVILQILQNQKLPQLFRKSRIPLIDAIVIDHRAHHPIRPHQNDSLFASGHAGI